MSRLPANGPMFLKYGEYGASPMTTGVLLSDVPDLNADAFLQKLQAEGPIVLLVRRGRPNTPGQGAHTRIQEKGIQGSYPTFVGEPDQFAGACDQIYQRPDAVATEEPAPAPQ